jgi:hypothetical protein
MDIDVRAREYVRAMLPILLSAVAKDRGCSEDDLSLGMVRACEQFGLDCFREGYEHAHEEVTVRIPKQG